MTTKKLVSFFGHPIKRDMYMADNEIKKLGGSSLAKSLKQIQLNIHPKVIVASLMYKIKSLRYFITELDTWPRACSRPGFYS